MEALSRVFHPPSNVSEASNTLHLRTSIANFPHWQSFLHRCHFSPRIYNTSQSLQKISACSRNAIFTGMLINYPIHDFSETTLSVVDRLRLAFLSDGSFSLIMFYGVGRNSLFANSGKLRLPVWDAYTVVID